MKISYSWLKQYVDTDLAPERVSEVITSTGLEVDSMERIEAIRGGLAGVVVGEVLTCDKHPDADKLSVTTVDVGEQKPLSIVCGAPNVAKGQKVLVATIGTTLYFSGGEVTIKKAKLRGVSSEGMICAEDELGLGTSHEGIMVLPGDTPVGMPARELFKLDDDYVYEIGLTPNRIDAASHYGVARDLAAYQAFHSNTDTKAVKPDVSGFSIDSKSLTIPVEVVNTSACRRYSAITVSNVTVAPSPEWLQKRLKSIGINPINNIVDVTNYVLHEVGQPLHAFDADAITGGRVVVQTLAEGTPFITLDGVERKLSADDLMICNGSEPMCIAGVFGGLSSGITAKTTRVFIESACFNPVYVRRTARKHGLSTDASFRYERGTDPNITIWALKRAAMLIREVAGGQISSDIVDVYPEPLDHFRVEFNVDSACRLIGMRIPNDQIERILTSLEISVIEKNDYHWVLAVPTYRVDVTREADVVEEILRIFGYDNVEIPEKVSSTLNFSKKPDNFTMQSIACGFLTGNGFNEIMCNSLTKKDYYEKLTTYPACSSVEILNPLSSDLNVMRQTLLFGGMESIQRNTNYRRPNLKLFEFGNCYRYNADLADVTNPLDRYSESFRIAMWMTGLMEPEHWMDKHNSVNFYHLKAFVHALLARFGLDVDTLSHTEAPSDLFSYGLSYLSGSAPVASFGLISSSIADSFDIKAEVFFAEIEWSALLTKLGETKISFRELPKYPEVRRDLALLLDNSVSYEQVRKLAFATERKLLRQVTLFDVYQGNNLPQGKKSYAVSFILQDETRTLTDEQIDATMKRLVDAYAKQLGAQLR